MERGDTQNKVEGQLDWRLLQAREQWADFWEQPRDSQGSGVCIYNLGRGALLRSDTAVQGATLEVEG